MVAKDIDAGSFHTVWIKNLQSSKFTRQDQWVGTVKEYHN